MSSKRAAGYFRVSTKAQATERNVSLDVQKTRFQTYCLSHGLMPQTTYTDVLSGTKDNRKQYQAMLRAIEANELDAVVVMFLDRFGRSTEEILFQVFRLRREYGVEVHCTDEEIDDVIRLFFSSWKAGEESARIGQRVRAAALHKVRNGNRWGKIPYGFRKTENGTIELHPTEAGAIRRAARLLLDENLGLRQVAQRLNDSGHRRKHGQPWDARTLRGLMLRTSTIGIVTFGKPGTKYNLDGQRDHARTDKALPVILDSKTQTAIRERLEQRRTLPAGRSQRSPFLLTGLLKCGLCGAAMHGTYVVYRQKWQARVYRCGAYLSRKSCVSNRQNAEKIETAILTELAKYADPDEAATLLPVVPVVPDHTVERADIQRALKRLDGDFIAAFRLYTSGVFTDESQLARANRALQSEQQRLQAQLAALDAEDRRARAAAERIAALPAQVAGYLDSAADLTIQQRKHVLSEIIHSVQCWPDHRILIKTRIGT
jgi:site-specific DNA recombinase